jgi:DNA-binding transcriptional ArsR family regulator
MPESFYFPVYSGLLTAQHREKIGPAIWEFLWLVSKVTKEEQVEDETWGIVLGGRPVKVAEIVADLGGNERNIRRNLARLKEHGYIDSKRAPYGEIYKVRKSKKFTLKKRSAKIGISANEREDKNVLSDTERPDKNDLSVPTERTFFVGRPDKNVRCNKDIKDIKKEEEEEKSMSNNSAFQLIANKFIQRRGRGLVLSAKDEIAIERLLSDNIPLDTILKLMDEVFDDYKPKHRMDYIQTFEYVEKGILDRYYNIEKANGKKDNLQVLDEIARKYGVS